MDDINMGLKICLSFYVLAQTCVVSLWIMFVEPLVFESKISRAISDLISKWNIDQYCFKRKIQFRISCHMWNLC
jgi:hypothetical protein